MNYVNRCYRKGPCLHGSPVEVSREEYWDYYDRSSRSFIFLDCRLHQKHFGPSLLQIEEDEKYASGLSTETYETSDLQLADTNGIWFTRSDDPDLWEWPDDLEKRCGDCDIVCDIRDVHEYMLDDGTCPFTDAVPYLKYSRVEDGDSSCKDFLHPLLLQDIAGINRRRRRTAKVHIWKYLREKKWRDALICKEDRMVDVWSRNYKPVQFYFRSFETIVLYLKNLPLEMKRNSGLLDRIRENVRGSPSYRECLERGEWEERMLEKITEEKEKSSS
jgi:hypothetical protein